MQNSSISDKNQNYILSLFQTEEYKQNGSIGIFVDNSSPLLNSDEVINFFTEQLMSHPQTRNVIFDYTRGKTHSNINHSSFV